MYCIKLSTKTLTKWQIKTHKCTIHPRHFARHVKLSYLRFEMVYLHMDRSLWNRTIELPARWLYKDLWQTLSASQCEPPRLISFSPDEMIPPKNNNIDQNAQNCAPQARNSSLHTAKHLEGCLTRSNVFSAKTQPVDTVGLHRGMWKVFDNSLTSGSVDIRVTFWNHPQ